MIVIVGIKYDCGVIIGSDSQATLIRGVPLKKLNHLKLFEITESKFPMIMGGAGTVAYISKVISSLRNQMRGNVPQTFDDFVTSAERSMIKVTRWHNFDKLQDLAAPVIPTSQQPEKKVGSTQSSPIVTQQMPIQAIDVILLIGTIDESGEPQLAVIHNEGLAEIQQVSAAVGSGAAYAEYVMSQLINNKGLSEKEALKIACHAINEVIKIDPGVGGDPVLFKVTQGGCLQISDKEVRNIQDKLFNLSLKTKLLWRKYLKENE